MRIEKTYIADDGKRFDSEIECRIYEKESKKTKTKAILQEIKNLDLTIWKKYHPDYKEDDFPDLHESPTWLKMILPQ